MFATASPKTHLLCCVSFYLFICVRVCTFAGGFTGVSSTGSLKAINFQLPDKAARSITSTFLCILRSVAMLTYR